MIRVQAKTVNSESWQAKTKVNRAVPISRALRAYLDRCTPQEGVLLGKKYLSAWVPEE
jgi:hypothetical protein